MPFYRKPRNFTPLATLAERKSIKNGLHHAIFTSRFDRYTGDWHVDKKQGQGFFLTITGKLYEGDWYEGFRHGFGTLSHRQENGVFRLDYSGDWVRGKPDGVGWWWYDNGDVYFGHWKHGKRHGYGKMWYHDGSYYVGYWGKGMKKGMGMFVQVDGNRYEGHWEDDKKNGLGRFYHMHTGQLQEGCWVDGICVKSKMTDIIIRQFCDLPTEYPLPPVQLDNSRKILKKSEFWLKQKIEEIDKYLQFCIDQMD
ncbi:hypothetical protein O0L34_g7249 [Tuta absoluta]|nr:hypothetical protein O0L34_g7249 [Tuta absoluta]